MYYKEVISYKYSVLALEMDWMNTRAVCAV